MKKLLETEKAEIRFNPSTRAIELIWKSYADPATYKTVFTEGIKYMKEFGADAWLSDIRKQGVVGPGDAKWLQNEIIPKAVEAGLKRIAVIMDSDIFKKFYVGNIETDLQKKGQKLMHYFKSEEEANSWLALSSVC